MVVQHGEPTDGDREDLSKFPEPILEALLTVDRHLGEKEGAADAAGGAK